MKSFIIKLAITPFILALALTSAQANPAEFAGHWLGQGTYIFDGDMTDCSKFELIFNAGNNRFTFASGHRVCGDLDEKYFPVTVDYRDGNIFFNGQKVGSYTDNTMEMGFRMPDGDSFRNWRMTMRRQGDHLMYEESRTMEGESTPLISFAGLLVIQ